MKVSLIIAVYKDLEALKLIVSSMKEQTYKNFEIIIAEDNNSKEMAQYINSIKDLDIIHTTQEDIGIRKSRSQNNGILASTGEYLIFIDGDCIPYSTFIERHVKLAKRKRVLSGRRVNLGPYFSKKIRNNNIKNLTIEKYFSLLFPLLVIDGEEGHIEAGFQFDINSYVYKKFIAKRKTNNSILGCNFSLFKEDFIALNGFDEGYGSSPLSDDTDLQWRFKGVGYEIISCKNIANQFHLYHKRANKSDANIKNILQLFDNNKKNKQYRCIYGLDSH